MRASASAFPTKLPGDAEATGFEPAHLGKSPLSARVREDLIILPEVATSLAAGRSRREAAETLESSAVGRTRQPLRHTGPCV